MRLTDIDFVNRTARPGETKNGKPRLLPLTYPVIKELMRFRENTNHLVFPSTVSQQPFDIKKLAESIKGVRYWSLSFS